MLQIIGFVIDLLHLVENIIMKFNVVENLNAMGHSGLNKITLILFSLICLHLRFEIRKISVPFKLSGIFIKTVIQVVS